MTDRWRNARRLLAVGAVLVGLPLLLATALLAGAEWFAVSIDATRWRDAAAQRASAALGRPVVLQGTLGLTFGRELVLRSGGLRVLNPPGFSGPELFAAGPYSVRIGLLDALRGRLRVQGVDASEVHLALEQTADGRGNWVFAPPRDPATTAGEFDIGRVALHGVTISHVDARSAARRQIDLDEVTASGGSGVPLRLLLQGRAGPQRSYKLRLEGGPLALLQDSSQAWPFQLALAGAGSRLQAHGEVVAGQARFDFQSSADDLAPLGALIGAAWPRWPAALQGSVVLAGDEASISKLRGRLGDSEITGRLALAFGGERPRLAGALNVDAFDLRAFLADAGVASGEATADAAPPWSDRHLSELLPFDVELDLGVGRWPGWPVDLRDTRFELRADRHGLRIPMAASVADTPVSGLLELDAVGPLPQLAWRLDAQDVALGALAEGVPAASGIEGRLGTARLRVGGRGDTVAALLQTLDVSLAVTQARAATEDVVGGRPLSITLATLDLALRHGERLRGSARGTLLGEPVVVSLRGGSLQDLMGGPQMPFELAFASAAATLRLQGQLSSDAAERDLAVNFVLSAARSGDLSRWLGGGAHVAPESKLPLALKGRLAFAGQAWRLDDTTLKLGRSDLAVSAHRSDAGGRSVIVASVHAALIDVPELLTLRSGTSAGTGAGTGAGTSAGTSTSTGGGGSGPNLDAPLLGGAVLLPDVDLDLRLDRVLLGRTELADLGLQARVRDGRLPPSPLTGRLAGAPFTGAVGLDLRSGPVQARLELGTGAIDVGLLLRGLGAAEDIDGRSDAFKFTLQARGHTLRELASHADVEARLQGGSVSVRGAARHTVAEIRFDEAVIGAAAGGPVRAVLDGAWERTPVRIEIATGTLIDLARDASRLPFTLEARAAQTQLRLDGEVALPLGSAARLNLELLGERLDTLSSLARVELPAWGPWSLRGPIRLTPTSYELPELQMRVGDSRLDGAGRLDVSTPRPRLEMRVAAPRIQLDDFPLPQRLADVSDPPPLAGNADAVRVAASRLAEQTQQLLSAGFLRRFDATIDVQAEAVLSGIDRLADGALHLQLQDGRLNLDPAVLNLPGGRLQLAGSYDLKGADIEFSIAAQIERFDYGIIARRLGRADDVSGLFSLNLELEGRAPTLASIMRKANGRVDLAVWPNDLRVGVFNLWSVNLVLTLLPLIDPGGQSRVNCVVGRFDLRDGVMTGDKILIDTNRVRVRGAGQVDLASEALSFVFRPRAKGLALFRLQTPFRVSGTLTDQRFGFNRRDLVESTLRLVASPILLPIERLVLGPLPHDGADVCTDPLRGNSPKP